VTDYPNRLRTFTGAVAIISGGASGIGRALAEALADSTRSSRSPRRCASKPPRPASA